MKLTVAQEDYLKTIWKLGLRNRRVSVKMVAEKLKVASSTVLSMLGYLGRLQLLEYNKVDGAILTELGDSRARKLIRKHRLVETFLEDVLQLNGDILHREAEKLEHVISDQLMLHIDAHLGYPPTDPHGESIPRPQEELPVFALSEISEGQQIEILERYFSEPELDYFDQYGLINGTHWQMVQKDPGNSVYLVRNASRHLALTRSQAEQVKVILTLKTKSA